MDMKIIKSEKRLCTCCMEEHEVKTVLVEEQMTFKNVKVVYKATYFSVSYTHLTLPTNSMV